MTSLSRSLPTALLSDLLSLMRTPALITGVLCASSPASFAEQTGEPAERHKTAPSPATPLRIVAVRTDEELTIDGRLDEATWITAPIIDDFIQIDPVEGASPTQRTEARVLYDRDHLYIGFRCSDTSPDRIVATQMRRDAGIGSDDRVSVAIDPYFDQRNGFLFQLGAAGARVDGIIENNQRLRNDWDGNWYGRTMISDTGWTAEFAIPYKTISFKADAPAWGINFQRVIARDSEVIRWAGRTRNSSIVAVGDAGELVGLDDIEKGVGIDFKPFSVFSVGRDDRTGHTFSEIDGGADLFFRLTPSLRLSLTFNTDFAETEVDERQINLTRFPLFFPEKRDFFLEDAQIFDFGGIRRNPLPFFSRRIGIGPGGRERDIFAGAKLTGKIEDLNLGLLAVQMKDDEELGEKTFLVGRASVDVLEESSLGFIFTDGDPNSRGGNTVAGLDFLYRYGEFGGDRVIDGSAFILGSDTTGEKGEDYAFGGKLNYPNDRVSWGIGFTEIGEDFDARLGFVPRPGIREYFGNWRYRWRPEDGIRRIDSGLSGMWVTSLDGATESQSVDWQILTIELDTLDRFFVNMDFEREVLFDPFEIQSGIVVPSGDYRWNRGQAGFVTSDSRPVSLNESLRSGGFFAGTRQDLFVGLEARPSRFLFLGFDYEESDIDLPQGDFRTEIARLRCNVAFSPELSWTTFAQYDNVSDTVGINRKVRWIVEPGSELFVVLNQGLDVDGNELSFSDTELTTKIGWTFRF